jgi:8-oxo-dGTP pyrophosphatase MutT (NUDIX family)
MSREDKQHKIEVHVAGICFRETQNDIEVLIVKRQKAKKIYPEKWECGGGQVLPGENFEEAVQRKIRQELGVIVDRVLVFGNYEIETPELDQKKIPGIKFICFWHSYVNGKNPVIDEKEHSEWKWQSVNELMHIDFASNIREDIMRGWEFYSNNKNIL